MLCHKGLYMHMHVCIHVRVFMYGICVHILVCRQRALQAYLKDLGGAALGHESKKEREIIADWLLSYAIGMEVYIATGLDACEDGLIYVFCYPVLGSYPKPQ